MLSVTIQTVCVDVGVVFNALQVVGELSHITGISRRSISDFAHVTLMHIVNVPAFL